MSPRCPTTSCSPTGPGPMTAFRPGTRSSRSSSPRRSSSGSTSSAARCWRSPTVPSAPTFANTVEALEKAGQRLDRVLSLFGVMTDNMTTPAYQALEKEWSPKLSAAERRDHPQPEALPARQDGLRGARERRSRRQAAAAGDPALRQLRPPRRQSRRPSRRQQLTAYNSQLAGKFAVFGEKVLADESTYITATEAELKGVPADVKAAAASAAPGAQASARQLRDRQHPLGGRSDPDLRRQSRASREGVARLRQPRRQWRRQRHQRGHRRDRQASRRPGQAARLLEPCRVPDAGHDGEVAGQGAGPDEPGLARRGRPGEGRGRRHAGARPQDRPQPHHRAVGLSLLSGEGPQAALQPHPGGGEALFRAEQHHRRPRMWSAGELYGLDFKEITGTVPVWNPDIRVYSVTDRASRQAGRSLLPRRLSPAPASARAPGRPPIEAAPACSATTSCSAPTTTISSSPRRASRC